jgi:SAM-dependent methyltransferase
MMAHPLPLFFRGMVLVLSGTSSAMPQTGRLARKACRVRHESTRSKPTSWGLGHVDIRRTYSALDVRCGGGRTIQKVANLADQGRIYGVDYSKTAVAVSRALNRAGIEAGRVDFRLATVSSLPFEDCEFDLVTAVETHYYWPNRTGALLEIRRALKPGGRLVIIAEAYRGRTFDWAYRTSMKLLRGVTSAPMNTAFGWKKPAMWNCRFSSKSRRVGSVPWGVSRGDAETLHGLRCRQKPYTRLLSRFGTRP